MGTPKKHYTDKTIRHMIDQGGKGSPGLNYWDSNIRAAAKERGASFSSVTPLNDVVAFLRATLAVRSI